MDPKNTAGISLRQIFSQICAGLGNSKDVSNFPQLNSDEDRFKFAYNVCRDFIENLNFKRNSKSYEKYVSLGKVGDSYYSKHNYWEALKAYNESMAFAPTGSEHLSFALFKRSLTLSWLSFPEEAANDCTCALRFCQKESLEIDIRNQQIILEKTGNTRKKEYFIGTGEVCPLNGGKSTFFDCASSSVGLSIDDSFGRQLVAENDIKTGEVLIVEKPYASVLLHNHLYLHCTHCYKRSMNLMPCRGCAFAMFCSDECWRESQRSYHQIECKIFDILAGLKLERMELLSLRILLIASEQGRNLLNLYKEIKNAEEVNENNEQYKSSDFKNIYNLVTNTGKRSGADLFYRSVISIVLIHLLDSYTDFFAAVENPKSKDLLKVFCGGLILRFMQSLPCNAHEVSEFCEDGFEEIGAGAYATLSLINHSCDPNVVRFSSGDVIILRAIKPIKKGEQLLDNYGYHYATHSLKDRQAALKKQYYFKCRCEACVERWPTYELLPSEGLQLRKQVNLDIYVKQTEKFERNLNEIFKGNFNQTMIDENMRYLDFLHEYVQRPWQNYNKCQEAIKHCLSFSGNHFRSTKGVPC